MIPSKATVRSFLIALSFPMALVLQGHTNNPAPVESKPIVKHHEVIHVRIRASQNPIFARQFELQASGRFFAEAE